MTLTKNMSLGVLGLLLLIFLGTYLITVTQARNYFYTQLESNAQDTATSLGLSLSQALTQEDKATMLSMVQAVFDRGYFSSIVIKDMQGKIIIARQAHQSPLTTPSWFVKLIQKPNKAQKSLVMSGWRQVGVVSVISNPDYAEKMLWNNALALMKAYVFFALIALLTVYLFIHWLLKPLQRLKAQAQSIRAFEFPIEKKLPKTLELKEVTLAMNSMVKRIKELFNEQIKQIEALRKEAYQDPLTGLANRQFFLQQLDALLKDKDDFIPGFVLIISLDGLYELYKKEQTQEANALTIAVAEICLAHWSTLVFRISGNNFTIIVQNKDLKSYQKNCSEFHLELQQLEQEHREVQIILGSTSYELHQAKSTVLSELDHALMDARNKTTKIAYRGQESDFEKLVLDLLDLESALGDNRFLLYAQPVLNSKNKLFHEEVLLRMQTTEEEEISAGYFMPYAEKLHIAHQIDIYVLSKAEKSLNTHKKPLAFNLSTDTLTVLQNCSAYLEKLGAIPLKIRKLIHIELNESLVIKHFAAAQSLVQALRQLQIKVGIDQFGLHFSSLYYLNEIPIHYIKLHGSLIQDITNHQSKTFSPHYFYKITKGLGIEVIATQVEKKEQWEALQTMSIRWGQGLYLGVSKKLR